MYGKIVKCIYLFLSVIFLTSCSLPFLDSGGTRDGIVIAGGNTSERQILSEIQKQMVEHYMDDVNVEIINNLGSTVLIVQTFIKDICNMSGAMYTGTSITSELNMEHELDPKVALKKVQDGYKEKFNMKWYGSYGFENTYAFMVRRDFAQKNNLKKISDLKSLAPTLKLGVDVAWIRRKGDGYEGFKEKYKFDFEKVYPMEIGLVYDAVKNNEMDIVLGYSTDGRINSYDLMILQDDLRLFPPYDACPVASYELIEKYPKLDSVISKLIGKIDNQTMQRLNSMSDEQQIEPQNVAKIFLEENNYFE